MNVRCPSLWERTLSAVLALLMSLPMNLPQSVWADPIIDAFIVNDGDPSRSRVTHLAVRLAPDTTLVPGGFSLLALPSGLSLPASNLLISTLAPSNEIRVAFTNLPGNGLPDGNYSANVVAFTATNAAGPRTSDSVRFHSRFGDRDGDRDVDFHDTFWLRETWQQDSGSTRYDPRFDQDGDGFVTTNDLAAFQANYFTVLPSQPAIFAHLVTDDLDSPSDGITTDPSVAGAVLGANAGARLRGGVANLLAPNPADDALLPYDLSASVSTDGRFTLSRSRMAQLAEGSLGTASYRLFLQLVEADGSISARFDLAFEFRGDVSCPLGEGWTARVGSLRAPNGIAGYAGIEDCVLFLRVRDAFEVSMERTLHVPPGAGVLRITFGDPFPAPDGAADTSVRDAFEMALVDDGGRPVVHTIAGESALISRSAIAVPALPPTPDAFFNVTEGLMPIGGPGTSVALLDDGQVVVTLDISSLGGGATSTLILRLISNNGDGLNQVVVSDLTFESTVSFARGQEPRQPQGANRTAATQKSVPLGMVTFPPSAASMGTEPIRRTTTMAATDVAMAGLHGAQAAPKAVRAGYAVERFARVERPSSIAYSRPGSPFGEGLFVGVAYEGDPRGTQFRPDEILRISPGGVVTKFAELKPEADPAALEFPPDGSLFGTDLYVSANNQDGDRPADQGGAILRVKPSGGVKNFTAEGAPNGPNEPNGIVFSDRGPLNGRLFLANSQAPSTVLEVGVDGALREFMPYSEPLPHGIAMSPAGDAVLLGAHTATPCRCIMVARPGARQPETLYTLPTHPYSLRFGPGGRFGTNLYVLVQGIDNLHLDLVRVGDNGVVEPIITGFGYPFLWVDAIEFSPDGNALFVADYSNSQIWRVTPPSWADTFSSPQIRIASPSDQARLPKGGSQLMGQALADSAAGLGARFSSGPDEPMEGAGNRIVAVMVNGRPVDSLDAAGNFFAAIDVRLGENRFDVVALDAFGQSSTRPVTVFGLIAPERFASLGEVSASVTAKYGQTSFNDGTSTLYTEVFLRNEGTYRVGSPLRVGVVRISDPTVRVLAPDGVSADGIPYYDFTEALQPGGLEPRAQTRSRPFAFHNPNRVPFTYELVVLGQLNRPPEFTGIPRVEAVLSRAYSYRAAARDPDGDAVRYSAAQLPDGASFAPDSGLLEWQPREKGTFEVLLGADDRRGGTASQRFHILVIDPPSNRPPAFVTIPDTVARMAPSDPGYRYDSLAEDPDGDTVKYSLVGGPAGLRIDPETGTVSWAPSAEQLGEHDVVLRAEDGRGGRADQSYRVRVLPVVGNRPPAFVRACSDLRFGTAVASGTSALAVDADGDNLRYKLRHAPESASVHPVSGSLTWRSESAPAPDASFVLEVTDGRGGTDTLGCSLVRASAGIGTLAGSVFEDRNGDGQIGTEDAPLAGVRVFADRDGNGFADEGEPEAVTTSLGRFEVGRIPDGPYSLRLVAPTSHVAVLPADLVHSGSLENAGSVANLDFALRVRTAIDLNRPPRFVSTGPSGDLLIGEGFSYLARALDPDGDAVQFSLVAGPTGMAIDAARGWIGWRPTHQQSGEQEVTIRVQDTHGDGTIQSFRLRVLLPNTAPVIASLPPGPASVGFPYGYLVRAQDAEGQPLNFDLGPNRPTGASLRAVPLPAVLGGGALGPGALALLSWTPGLSHLGTNRIDIVVRDSEGAEATQAVHLAVVPSSENHPPRFLGEPVRRARIGTPYGYLDRASDPDGDPLRFQLLDGPTGLTLESRLPAEIAGSQGSEVDLLPMGLQFVHWVPKPEQMGPHLVRVQAQDGRGGSAGQEFTIVVGSSLTNAPPRIVSSPPPAAIIGEAYLYDLRGEDEDGDPLSWRLVGSPAGVSLDPTVGTLRWVPTLDQIGTNAVTVEARDPFLATDAQTFFVDVGCLNRPPRITSDPLTSAGTESPYTYAVRAEDPEGDRLAWSLVEDARPSGMTIDASTGLIRWTPTLGQAGAHPVTVRVTDTRGASGTQEYTVHVSNQRVNRPPVFVSGPTFGALAGRPYSYEFVVTDPDADNLTLSGLRLPSGALVRPGASSSGRAVASLIWNPEPSQIGDHEIVLAGRDSAGASTAQRYLLTVRSNSPPTIAPIVRIGVPVGIPYRVDVLASDRDGDPLTYNLFTGPEGMSFDRLGRIEWTPPAESVGQHPVIVSVSDGFGGEASHSYTLHVLRDEIPPTVSLTLISGLKNIDSGGWAANLGSTVQVKVEAIDDVEVASTALRLGPQYFPLNEAGVASIPVTAGGIYEVIGEALDTAGNLGTVTQPILFRDPNATNNLFVRILSPTNDAVISRRVPIVATLTNAVPIARYRVDYAPADEINLQDISLPNPAWVNLSDVTLTNAPRALEAVTVATFDPLSLINDSYIIRVYAQDANGQSWYEPVLIGVEGDLKFGEFRLPITDLTIPLAGIPITVTRVYDSRLAGRSGDFGHGWCLGIQDAMIRVGTPDGGVRPGSRVYLTGPDGRRLGFNTDIRVIGGFLSIAATEMFFRPDAGIYDRLEAGNLQDIYIGQNSLGESLFGAPTLNEVRLTTRDGTRYDYSRTEGLRTITDLNGNRIRYTRDGIFHYPAGSTNADQSVRFVRDARGRIERVQAPDGSALSYTYDAAGDLRAFTDQVANVTRFVYDSRRPHFLTNIVDPRGIAALSLVYDDTGKLSEIRDASGNPIRQDFDADRNIGTFTDGRGYQTVVHFDNRGNETARIIPGISTNLFAYDQSNNLTNAINGHGYSTNFVYDARGNLTRVTDALGHVTAIAYGPQDKPTEVVNPLGQKVRLRYDTAGQLLGVVNNAGYTTTLTRDSQGRVTSLTDAVGNTTRFDYENGCSCGRPGKVINPDGSFRLYGYDALGNTNLIVNELGAATRMQYDRSGRLLWIEDPLTNRTVYTYDAGRLVRITDPLGRPTEYRYDEQGRTNRIINAEGGVVEFRYDSSGNRTHVIDPVGNFTQFVYDPANRLDHQIDPLGHTNHFAYDGEGNRVEAIDRNGRRRTFAYDAMNRMTNELWWEGTNVVKSMVFDFNELGIQTLAMDEVARYDYQYDPLNRLASTVMSGVTNQPDFTLFYTYTSLGQVESVTDNWGVRVGSKYDVRNRLAQRDWSGGEVGEARVNFAYDHAGNRLRLDRFADLAGTNRIGFTTNAYNRMPVSSRTSRTLARPGRGAWPSTTTPSMLRYQITQLGH
jgi:YD repeat-containing protein